MYIHGYLIPGI